MSPWKNNLDDTISYIKEEYIEHVLSKLNGYHDDIEFTYEIENDDELPFLDVPVICKDYEVETTVYHRSTNRDIYLQWQSFSPTTWKRGTLQILVSRAFKVSSNDQHLHLSNEKPTKTKQIIWRLLSKTAQYCRISRMLP